MYFENAFRKQSLPVKIRHGTPISDGDSNDFLSPRRSGDNNKSSKEVSFKMRTSPPKKAKKDEKVQQPRYYDVLPYFNFDEEQGVPIDSEEYFHP